MKWVDLGPQRKMELLKRPEGRHRPCRGKGWARCAEVSAQGPGTGSSCHEAQQSDSDPQRTASLLWAGSRLVTVRRDTPGVSGRAVAV